LQRNIEDIRVSAERLRFLFFCYAIKRNIITMAQEVIYLTAEGYKKLKDELDHMRSVERPAASAAIAEARDKGDLSENAEYDAAREAQGMLEMKIAQMEATLANARIIDETKIDRSKVQILSKVTLLNHNNNRQVIYTIVAEHEANLREGKLAIGTPIAKALLGKKKGDIVEVTVPAGVLKFEILDISI
jgi:transcription elongation factor GreA